MAPIAFRLRGSERDRESDRSRMQRVLDMVVSQLSGVEAERAGLRNRYHRAADDAAFSLQAVEDEGALLSPRVDALTDTMSLCEQRLRYLERQESFLAGLRESITAFMTEPGADTKPPRR